ncbi:hypothetical protein PQX77_003076 [Marasmius sp. AFHP31]|nr:hypothetical protein PQX77_003076 [Marasmius sp. AFHP31]
MAYLAVAAGLTSYLIFKRTETIKTIDLITLLVLIPVLLAFLPLNLEGRPHSYLHSLSGVATSFIGYYTTIIFCTILYRLSPWHPLASYPGPLICKITKFKGAFVSRRGKQHIYHQRLHEKYGDVVRIGPNELSFVNVNAVFTVLGRNGAPRGPYWDGRIPETQQVYPIGAVRDIEEHRRRRIPWSKAFSSVALKEYERPVRAKTKLLAERLASVARNDKGVVELGTWFGYYTYDVMTSFAFSGGSDMLREGDPQGLWKEIRGSMQSTMLMGHVPWLGRLCYRLPVGLFNGLNAFRKASYDRATKRMSEGSTDKDLYYYLLDESNPHKQSPEGMDRARVISDSESRLVAIPEMNRANDSKTGSSAVLGGSDTTAATTTLLCYYLATHSKVYEHLEGEVDAAGDKYDDPSVQAKMEYLNAVINEVLRMWPAVLNGSPRGIKANDSGRMIAGNYVPPGTNLTIPSYSIQRDPRNFAPQPENFIPERWLDEETRVRLRPDVFHCQPYRNDPQAFLTFSTGPANCVGKNLALMEMRMVACTLVKRFRFVEVVGRGGGGTGGGRDFEDTVMDYFTMQVGELWVRLREKVADE